MSLERLDLESGLGAIGVRRVAAGHRLVEAGGNPGDALGQHPDLAVPLDQPIDRGGRFDPPGPHQLGLGDQLRASLPGLVTGLASIPEPERVVLDFGSEGIDGRCRGDEIATELAFRIALPGKFASRGPGIAAGEVDLVLPFECGAGPVASGGSRPEPPAGGEAGGGRGQTEPDRFDHRSVRFPARVGSCR